MPSPRTPEIASTSRRLSRLTYSRGPDDPATVAARREVDCAKLDEHIRRVVDAAPPLTREQRDRLAVLLRPVRA